MPNILLETVFGSKLQNTYTLEQAFEIFAEQNLIEVGELAEKAISKQSGVAQCDKNTPEIDLVSGKQIKHAQTNPNGKSNIKNNCLKAWFGIENTSAPILLVVTERLTKQQYFFYIPYRAYQHMNANAVSIPFELDGTPRRSNHWWDHEISSWEELCKMAK
jgi:hypothetical protein